MPLIRLIVPFAAWIVAITILALFGGSFIEPPSFVKWGGVLLFAIFLPITPLSPIRRFATLERDSQSRVFFTVSALAVLLALTGGGVSSLLSLALVCPLALATLWYGWERASLYAVALFAIALGLDVVLVGRAVDPESAILSALGIAGFLFVSVRGNASVIAQSPLAAAKADEHTSEAIVAAAVEHGRVEAATIAREASSGDVTEKSVDATGAGDIKEPWVSRGSQSAGDISEPIPHTEPEILARRLQQGSRQWWRTGGENRVVAEYLLDVRASTSAEEAVVWLLNDGDTVLRPLAACSSNQWAERSSSDEKWMALVRWSCEAAVIQTGALDDGGGYVTAPITLDGKLLGVLCLRRKTRFDENGERIKARVSHHTAYLARLVKLVDVHATAVARNEALDSALYAVRELQDHAPVESPASAICDAILKVGGCDASALVRWHSEVSAGSVEAGSGAFESFEQSAVQASSIVGNTCQRMTPLRIGTAHDLLKRLALFRDGERLNDFGALCVQPMKRDGEVIGALVASWNSPTDLMTHSAPSMEVLASVAAHALHAAWRLETVQIAARTDALTGLSNRRYLDEQLNRVLAEAGRYGDPASLILLDLDFFKKINDQYGHAVGDQVLKHVAETLLDGIRGVDVCARYGGEELAVLLPRTGLQGAVELAERLRSMVESRPLAISGANIKVTASFGVATYPSPAPNPAALLSSADGALYRAKEAGRNRVRSALP